jgi:hypothetical protein
MLRRRERTSLDESRMAWIFGSSRSGSTWLHRMLDDHPSVFSLNEPHIGHHLGIWRPIPLAWATAEEPPELTTLSEVKKRRDDYFFSERYREHWEPALRELILKRFEVQVEAEAPAEVDGKRTLVVQEPGGSHVADWIMALFPRSSLVWLLRDGRDVVDSWLDAYQDGSWANDEGAYPLTAEGRLPFVEWQATVWLQRTEVVQRAYDGQRPDRRVLVRYEELKADPVRELGRICGTLDIDLDESLLHRLVENHSFSKMPDEDKGPGKEVRMAKPGGWRENLSEQEVVAMMRIIGPKLSELGYDDETGRDRALVGLR